VVPDRFRIYEYIAFAKRKAGLPIGGIADSQSDFQNCSSMPLFETDDARLCESAGRNCLRLRRLISPPDWATIDARSGRAAFRRANPDVDLFWVQLAIPNPNRLTRSTIKTLPDMTT
jgi:hypothetical protein